MRPTYSIIAESNMRAPGRVCVLTLQVLYQEDGVAQEGKRHVVRASQEGEPITQTQHKTLPEAMEHMAGLIQELVDRVDAYFPNERGEFRRWGI